MKSSVNRPQNAMLFLDKCLDDPGAQQQKRCRKSDQIKGKLAQDRHLYVKTNEPQNEQQKRSVPQTTLGSVKSDFQVSLPSLTSMSTQRFSIVFSPVSRATVPISVWFIVD